MRRGCARQFTAVGFERVIENGGRYIKGDRDHRIQQTSSLARADRVTLEHHIVSVSLEVSDGISSAVGVFAVSASGQHVRLECPLTAATRAAGVVMRWRKGARSCTHARRVCCARPNRLSLRLCFSHASCPACLSRSCTMWSRAQHGAMLRSPMIVWRGAE